MLLLLPTLVLLLGLGVATDPPPPPSQEMVIALPDGTEATIAEILAAPPLPQLEEEKDPPSAPPARTESEEPILLEVQDLLRDPTNFSFLETPDDRDPYRLGRELERVGDLDHAIAMLRSVPRSHPQYARAQRYLGWDIYTQQLDQPRVGLTFVRASIHAEPGNGNAWQDGYRTLGQSVLPGGLADLID